MIASWDKRRRPTYQSELTSTWVPSKIPPFSQLKPDKWNLFLRWRFAVWHFSTAFKFVYATASHMLWFLCLLYVMTRLLRGHEELIVTTRNCAHRNVQLILFQTVDVSGPQLRKDPPWANFGRHYYVLAFWVVTRLSQSRSLGFSLARASRSLSRYALKSSTCEQV